ncbi:hypothetical protein FRC06_002595 [Ceratobasidium sp. 370]|nr:hypothetical protein FRC06_002595 [Ceratobasidium sp. 370]
MFADSVSLGENFGRHNVSFLLYLSDFIGDMNGTSLSHIKNFVLYIFYLMLYWLFTIIIVYLPHPVITVLSYLKDAINARSRERSGDDYTTVPMDIITSQMLSWIIANCEDTRSVDIALQAIAGTECDLPYEPLLEGGTLRFVLPRLDSYLKQGDNLPAACRYYQIYGEIMSRCNFETLAEWSEDVLTFQFLNGNRLKQALRPPVEHNLLASAVTTTRPNLPALLQTNVNLISAPVFSALVRSSSHYLIGVWPGEEQSDLHSLLPILLASTFISCHDTAPGTARAAAITLACAAFASSSYPGGERPTPNVDARRKRAADVLRHYQAHRPDKDTTMALFTFGFFGLLPHLDFSGPETRSAMLSYFNGAMQRVPQFVPWYRSTAGIRTLPPSYSVWEEAYPPTLQFLTSIANGELPDDELRAAFTCLPLLFHRDSKLYVLTLIALCRAKSGELRGLCINIIDAQPVPGDLVGLFNSDDNKALLEQLCRALIYIDTPVLPIAALHFELLIANIALTGDYQLQERRDALKPLLSLRDRFSGLKDPGSLDPDRIFSRPREELTRRKSILHTMQLVVDFCEFGLEEDSASIDWRNKLTELKESYKPGAANISHPGGEMPGHPSPHVEGAASSSMSETPSTTQVAVSTVAISDQ